MSQQQQQWFSYNTKAVALLQQNRYKEAAKLLRKGIQLVLEACRAQEEQDKKQAQYSRTAATTTMMMMMIDRRRAYDNNNASFSSAHRMMDYHARAAEEEEEEIEGFQHDDENEQQQSPFSVPALLPSFEQRRQRRKSLNDLEAAAASACRDEQEEEEEVQDDAHADDLPSNQRSLVLGTVGIPHHVDLNRWAHSTRLVTSPDQIFTFFHRAFVLRSTPFTTSKAKQQQSVVPRLALPVFLYNAGLAYHHRGYVVEVETAAAHAHAPEVRPSNKHWQTALRFYDMALKSVQHDNHVRQAWQEQNNQNNDDFYDHGEMTRLGQPASTNIPETLLLLACANNMGHIFSHSLLYEDSRNCCEMIRALLAPLADLDQAERQRRRSSSNGCSSSASRLHHSQQQPLLHPGDDHDESDPDESESSGCISTTLSSTNSQHKAPLKEPEEDRHSSSRQCQYQTHRKDFSFFARNVFFQNSPRVLLVPAAA